MTFTSFAINLLIHSACPRLKTWDDALGRDAESTVVENDSAESVEAFHVNAGVSFDALKIVSRSAVGSRITAKLLVVVL